MQKMFTVSLINVCRLRWLWLKNGNTIGNSYVTWLCLSVKPQGKMGFSSDLGQPSFLHIVTLQYHIPHIKQTPFSKREISEVLSSIKKRVQTREYNIKIIILQYRADTVLVWSFLKIFFTLFYTNRQLNY